MARFFTAVSAVMLLALSVQFMINGPLTGGILITGEGFSIERRSVGGLGVGLQDLITAAPPDVAGMRLQVGQSIARALGKPEELPGQRRGQTTTTGLVATTTATTLSTASVETTSFSTSMSQEESDATTSSTATTASTTTASTTSAATQDQSSPPPGANVLRPGDDVAARVDASPKGAVFYLTSGTYRGVSIRPKSGQVFLGAPGAALDGAGRPYAFRSSAGNVTIEGLEIYGYVPAPKTAVIHPEGAKNWTIRGNEIHHNAEIGVRIAPGWRLIDNHIHHNGRYGVAGSGDGVLIEGNEISYNSTDYGATGSSGGTKFVLTTNLVLRGNYVHNNYGNGLWVDINNLNALIEGNTVVANQFNGIKIEISCGGTIRNNRVERNGFIDKNENWMTGAGILVTNSPGVTVSGNRLVGNYKGIGGLHWDHPNRDAVTRCTPELRNLKVIDNSVTQDRSAAAGIDAKIDRDKVWSSWGNEFRGNSYQLSGGARFRWEGGWIGPSEWEQLGLD